MADLCCPDRSPAAHFLLMIQLDKLDFNLNTQCTRLLAKDVFYIKSPHFHSSMNGGDAR